MLILLSAQRLRASEEQGLGEEFGVLWGLEFLRASLCARGLWGLG